MRLKEVNNKKKQSMKERMRIAIEKKVIKRTWNSPDASKVLNRRFRTSDECAGMCLS